MFHDFDLPRADDFEFPKSPLSSPVPRMSLDFSLESHGEVEFDSLNFGLNLDDDYLCCSQPIDEIRELESERFEIQVMPKPKAPHKPTVFKPFSSFESLEMTVKGLRDNLSRDVRRTHSMPVADMS